MENIFKYQLYTFSLITKINTYLLPQPFVFQT